MSGRHWITLLGLAAVGCGSRPSAPQQPIDTARTQLVLENHVAWPYRVERAAIVIDGRLVSTTREAPDLGAQSIGEIALTRGRHTLTLIVDAQYPDAIVGGECAMRARKVLPLELDAAPAKLVVDLYSRDRTAPFHDGLGVAVAAHGTVRPPPPPTQLAPPPPSPECERADGVAEGALCKIEARMASAVDAGDPAWTSCLADKRAQLRALVEMRDKRQALANDAPEPLLRDHHQAVLGIVQSRIFRAAREIDRCSEAAVELARALERDAPRDVCADRWPLETEPGRDASFVAP